MQLEDVLGTRTALMGNWENGELPRGWLIPVWWEIKR